MFTDRTEAGERLLAALPELDKDGSVVVALPRGGVPVAEVIAAARDLPLDVALVRKVGVPGQPELAVAAVTDGAEPQISINEDVARATRLTQADIRDLAEVQLQEIARRRALYLGGRDPIPLRGRTVLVVDDGIATGATARAALQLLRKQAPAALILAVPVAPPETLAALEEDADRVICLETPRAFQAVGLHYRDFTQVSDSAVSAAIARNRARHT